MSPATAATSDMNKGVLPLNQASSQQVGMLATVQYNLPSTVGTSSSTFADVDAANLKVTFTAPPSGNVLVNLEGMGFSSTTTTYAWNLRDSGGDVAGTKRDIYYNSSNTIRIRCGIYVSGLTPGASYTWKWGHGLTFGSGSCGVGGNGSSEQALMTVTTA